MAENHHIDPETPPRAGLGRGTAALLLVLVVAGFYWKLTLSNQFTWLAGEDTASQVLPWLQFQAGEWHAGRMPLWAPGQWGGQPLIGQALPGAAYPLNWVLFSLPLREGWLKQIFLHGYFVAIHLMAAWFAYKLARELGCRRGAALFGGVAFSLTGWLGTIDWPQMLNGAVWAPLVFLYVFRASRQEDWKRALAPAGLAGFFLGVSWLSGHHQIPIFVSLAASGVWLWSLVRRRGLAPAFVLFLGMTFCAGAMQILPAAEYGKLARRWVGAPEPVSWNEKVPYDIHRTFSSSPAALLGIIFPNASRHVDPFLGITAFTLAGLGLALCWKRRETRLLAAIALGGFLYSLSHHFALNGVLYSLAPHLDKARSPAAAVFLFGLGGSILAALGLEGLLGGAGEPKWGRRAGWWALGVGLFVAAVQFVLIQIGEFPGAGDERRVMTAWAALLLAALLFALLRGSISRNTATVAAMGLLLLEVSNTNGFFMPTVLEKPRLKLLESMRQHDDIAAFLRRQPGLYRADIDDKLIRYNFGDWHGVQQVGGYLASVTENMWRIDNYKPGAKRLLGVAYAVGDKPTAFHRQEVFAGASGMKVFYNPDVLPRAFAVHEAYQIAGRERASSELEKLGAEVERRTFLLTSPPRLENCASQDSVVIESYAPNRIRMAASMGCRGMVVLTDTWFPGWSATVDGKPAAIHEAYSVVRGVVVEGGAHTVEFRYRPRSVMLGGLLSGLSLLAAVGLGWTMRARRAASSN
ncbi:MAG: hypothetical protein HY858_01850 [Candidatus Solibacter usitatus]|nr:hypothetical protein [Candidatus Solibacter usitatus]